MIYKLGGCLGIFIGLASPALGEAIRPAFADKPADSYAGTKNLDGSPLLWGQAPIDDFGSQPIRFNLAGVRPVTAAPSAGVHPRILFGPSEIDDVRDRLHHTRCGQEAWKNILSWTQMMKGDYDDRADYAQPDRYHGGWGGLHGRVPLFRLGVERVKGHAYNQNPLARTIYDTLAGGSATKFPPYYWNTMALEAFRCLMDEDHAAARKLSAAVVAAMRLDQAQRDRDRAALQAKKAGTVLPPPAQPVGAFQLAFCYDFLFNDMSADQRAAVHDELAATTWSHDNYGTFNTADGSRSNWATFSYWLYEVLAIEGEPGFNEWKVRGMYRGWRNLLTYGWYPSGATYEGEAKNQIGMDGVILFAKRAQQYGFQNLVGHPFLRAYADSFLPHSSNAMLRGFHKYDLLGGSHAGTGGFAPMDSVGLKYMLPHDKSVDWCYRQAVGDDYSGVPDRPDGYFNALLFFAVFAQDFDPGNAAPNAAELGNTFFCGERALLMTRSDWTPDATQLNFHVRQANGGHPFADRNAIMVAGAGRVWSPNGYASFHTDENAVVCIDGKSQQETVPGRMIDYADTPEATFAVGDVQYAWNWNWKRPDNRPGGGFYTAADLKAGRVAIPKGWELEPNSPNDFAYTRRDVPYLNRPLSELSHWIAPNGAISPMVRQPNAPVKRAFRSVGLVRGDEPYILVIDDIQKDDAPHRYEWILPLERDIQRVSQSQNPDGTTDIVLTGADPGQKTPNPAKASPADWDSTVAIPAGQPMLRVRILSPAVGAKGPMDVRIIERPNETDPKKYPPIRRLVIGVDCVSPDFRLLLYPYRQAQAAPSTSWKNGDTLVVKAASHVDTFKLEAGADGRTRVTLTREGTQVLQLNRAESSVK